MHLKFQSLKSLDVMFFLPHIWVLAGAELHAQCI